MPKEINTNKGKDIDEAFEWGPAGDPEVKANHHACRKLKAKKSGQGFRLTGWVTETGTFEVTITETKTTTVTIKVAPTTGLLDTVIWELPETADQPTLGPERR